MRTHFDAKTQTNMNSVSTSKENDNEKPAWFVGNNISKA